MINKLLKYLFIGAFIVYPILIVWFIIEAWTPTPWPITLMWLYGLLFLLVLVIYLFQKGANNFYLRLASYILSALLILILLFLYNQFCIDFGYNCGIIK